MLFHGAKRPAASQAPKSVRRGRTALVCGVTLFLALQVGFFPLSRLWPQIQDGEYGHKLANLRSQIRHKPKDKPVIVMFGSSLTGWGLNPSAMRELKPGTPNGPVVYNFGINSGGVVVELMCLKRLLAEGVRPNLVLIETHPWFLFQSYNRVADKEHFLPVPRLQPRDLFVLFRYDAQPEQLLREFVNRAWAPWYYHRHDIQNYLVPQWVKRSERIGVWDYTDRHGWEGELANVASGPPLTMAERVASARYHIVAMKDAPIFLESTRAYRDIVTMCQRMGIPVMLVRMPEMQAMREESPPALKEKIQHFYDELVHDTGVPMIDARDWVADEHFRDGFHLLVEGSAIFSSRLERELLGPFVASFGRPEDLKSATARER
jgi:hypothetical protein